MYAVAGVVAVVALLAMFVRRRGTLVEAGLRDWLIGEVAGATDSVYQLAVGNLQLSLFPGRISIDSLRLVTDTTRNDFRADPYPVLTATASGCRVTGIGTLDLLTARGVKARLFRCDQITATVLEVVRERAPVQSAAAADPRGGIPFLRDSLQLPALLPIFVLDRTELPAMSLDYTRRSRSGAETHVTLERLSIALTGTRLDPAIPPRSRKPLFSERAVVSADTLEVLGSKQQSAVLGHMRLSLTDSTLSLDSVVVGPRQSDEEWVKAQKVRSDRIRFQLDSARFRGVDYRRLASLEGALVARHGTLHGFHLDVLSDKRLPAGPPKKRKTPQQWMAAQERPIVLDTVEIASGKIAYHEHAVGKPSPGTMTWEQVHARIIGLKSPTTGGKALPPTVVDASAMLLGAAKLETTIEIPLSAPRFDMKYSGTLGPMDMTVLNQFVAKSFSARIGSGKLQSVKFSVVVRNGRSTGQAVPVYRDFKIVLEDKKANFFKKAGLSIVTLFANAFKVRGDNPGKPGEKPAVGVINYPYRPTASLPQVFWFPLREGLGKVFIK